MLHVLGQADDSLETWTKAVRLSPATVQMSKVITYIHLFKLSSRRKYLSNM